MKEILALIPARSGSKRLRDKNIRILAGKPLISYSILQALDSKHVTRVVVCTDSLKYAEIAREYGAEIPFIRPPEISGDLSTDLEVFQYTLKWFSSNEGYHPDICVHLRPTNPVRTSRQIDECIELLLENESYDSVRSVCKCSCSPYKMWYLDEDKTLTGVLPDASLKAANLPCQALPEVFIQNAGIDVVRTETIQRLRSMTGDKIRSYRMDTFFDIDDIDDFLSVEEFIRKGTG